MKKITFLLTLTISLFASAFIGSAIADFIGVNPFYVCVGLFIAPLVIKLIVSAYLGYTPRLSKNAFAGVFVESWVNYIAENLFKNNEFLDKSYDESGNVLNGVLVWLPQAGATPAVAKNTSSFPLTAVQRVDTAVSYPLDIYNTTPTHITLAETQEVSYDKIGNILADHMASLREFIADELLFKWAPTVAGNIIRTTGSASNIALAPGATGTRLAFLAADLRRAQATLDKQKISTKDRYALIPIDMYTQLLADTTLTSRDYQQDVNLKEGTAGRLYGFTLLTRPTVNTYDNSATPVPKTQAAATAVTDNLSVLCWQKDAVAKALGTINVFERNNDPLFLGDIYNLSVKCGGRRRRTGGEGVISIVQA